VVADTHRTPSATETIGPHIPRAERPSLRSIPQLSLLLQMR
jgi:hypothetical protein